MRSAYSFGTARLLLRLVKEVWRSKFWLAWLSLITCYLLPGSFSGLWFLLTKVSSVPLWIKDMSIVFWAGIVVLLQCLIVFGIWQRFLWLRADLPAPWNTVDLEYVFKACSTFDLTPIRGIHFICRRFGPDQQRVIRTNPWHFNHTMYLGYGGTMLIFWVTVAGLSAPVYAAMMSIIFESIVVLVSLLESSLGKYRRDLLPRLNFRYSPRHALASVLWALVWLLLMLSTGVVPQAGLLGLFLLPIVPTLILVSFLLHGHQPDSVSDRSIAIHRPINTFCATCISTVLDRDSKSTNAHHLKRDGLKSSALNGCRICAAVWQAGRMIRPDFLRLILYWKPATTYEKSFDGFSIHLNREKIEFEERQRRVADRWSRDMLDIRQRLNLNEMSYHTGSDQSLAQAREWLHQCIVFHGVCCDNQDENFNPSRLLYVADSSVFVRSMRDTKRKVPYLTLSHCWGKSSARPIRLQTSNVERFQEQILWSELPRTFQDAIRITRSLGYAYLWIDSLCIVQDSPADWKHEAELMGKVYQNSTCNIAASNAADSTHGCLYPRDARALQPTILHNSDGRESYLINRTDVYNDHPLYTRAWVLQEAVLARRTLDCGRGQLFFRCGEMRASEVFPGGVPTNIYNDGHPASKLKAISADSDQVILNANVLIQKLRGKAHELQRGPNKTSLEQFTDSPFAVWRFLVGDYTRSNLTQETDRTFAFAGIVDVFRPFFGEYAFGLWYLFMPAGLLWSRTGLTRAPVEWRAPSWSWLSVEGPVSLWSCDFKHDRDVLLTKFLGGSRLHLAFQTILLRARIKGADIVQIEGESRWTGFGGVTWDLPEAVSGLDQVYLMCVLVKRERDEIELGGLVLDEVDDGCFRRVGYFEDSEKLILPFVRGVFKRRIVLE